MPMWVSLVNLTEQGIRDIKQGPARLEEAAKGIEEVGGKLTGSCIIDNSRGMPRFLKGTKPSRVL